MDAYCEFSLFEQPDPDLHSYGKIVKRLRTDDTEDRLILEVDHVFPRAGSFRAQLGGR